MLLFFMPEKIDLSAKPMPDKSVFETRINYARLIIENEMIERPTLDQFADVYPKWVIEKDKGWVATIKSQFQENFDSKPEDVKEKLYGTKKRSEALEIIVGDQIEMNDWFGPNALFTRTTEYDDLVNGIDAVAEFNDPEDNPKRIALGIDASMKADLDKVRQKIERNISKVLNNNLSVKYFESQIDDYKGRLRDIIPVVIGVEGYDAGLLIEKFAQTIELQQKPDKNPFEEQKLTKMRQDLANHPVQIIFLREIQDQVMMYYHILRKENNPKIQTKPERLMETAYMIQSILDEKKDIENQPGVALLEKDGMYNLIQYISRSHDPDARNKT
jgi:hypothetical protein